jgi:hypothetical protein
MISATISPRVAAGVDAMHAQPLGDDLGRRHPRRQAAERVLEHDLHVAAQPRSDDPASASIRLLPQR